MRRLMALLALLPTAALAQTAPKPIFVTKAPIVRAAPTPVCTTSFCTGFYFGGGIDGNGTNADILGSGLSGSVFGAGAIPSVDAGYQFWNGSILYGVEVGVGYVVPTASSINTVDVNPAQKGFIGYQELQVGGKLSGLFGTNSPPPTVPTLLAADLIAPYVAIGVGETTGATALSTGAGLKFAISANGLLDIGYRFMPFNSTSGPVVVKNDNLIRVRFNYVY